MMMIKNTDGRKEPVVPEKIIVSAVKSRADPDYARTIATGTGKNFKDGTNTQEREVPAMLKSRDPEWQRNWAVYGTGVINRPGQVVYSDKGENRGGIYEQFTDRNSGINQGLIP